MAGQGEGPRRTVSPVPTAAAPAATVLEWTMRLNLLFRFHLVPTVRSVADAVRRGPIVWGVALFVVGTLVWQTARGLPLVRLPEDPLAAAALSLVGTWLVATVFSWPLVPRSMGWRAFFSARPHGEGVWVTYALGRSLVSWTLASLVVALACGLGGWLGLAVGALPFAGLMAALVRRPLRSVPRATGPQVGGVAAWWLSQPLLYVAPLVAWGLILAWAVSGQAGFSWQDHPTAGVLLNDFGWSTVFGLFWSEARTKVPWSYFRMARAPFTRVVVVVGAPVALATLVALAGGAVLSGSGLEALRSVALSLAGTSFWFGYWLRLGPSGPSVIVFGTLLVAGIAAERDWWVLWVLVQALGAAVLWAGWRTRYYEGDMHG